MFRERSPVSCTAGRECSIAPHESQGTEVLPELGVQREHCYSRRMSGEYRKLSIPGLLSCSHTTLCTLWGLVPFGVCTLWGQTDLEFSPLRPRASSSAMRSRLAFDSLWSRAANRADRLGTLWGGRGQGSARARRGWPRYGASPGRRGQRGPTSGSRAGRVGPGRPRTGCTPPRSPGQDPILEAGVAPGTGRDGSDRQGAGETIQESLTAEEPSMPCLGPRGGRRGSQTGRHEATVGCLRIGPSELAGSGRKQRVVGHPVQAIAAAENPGQLDRIQASGVADRPARTGLRWT